MFSNSEGSVRGQTSLTQHHTHLVQVLEIEDLGEEEEKEQKVEEEEEEEQEEEKEEEVGGS